ncbi:transposase [Chitinophaga oryzae]|uniref:Mutator family transposase n=1 Tax=Chitinophaga oryzae TaxID=2725414 RepID=A0ABX6LGD9_9BACT|nr:transposase [Chitinophaga oryzae]
MVSAIHYKVRHEGRVVSRAVYFIIGLNQEGYKELLGMYIGENEGAKFWLQVLTDFMEIMTLVDSFYLVNQMSIYEPKGTI